MTRCVRVFEVHVCNCIFVCVSVSTFVCLGNVGKNAAEFEQKQYYAEKIAASFPFDASPAGFGQHIQLAQWLLTITRWLVQASMIFPSPQPESLYEQKS